MSQPDETQSGNAATTPASVEVLQEQMRRATGSSAAYADNRDPVEVAEEWVAVALQGRPWEARDCDGEGPCFIERGTARNGDCERFISSPLTDLDAAIIERLLEVARGEAD